MDCLRQSLVYSKTVKIIALPLFLLAVSCLSPAALVAHWNFEEGSGTATDNSSNTATDAFGAGAAWSTDTPGPASGASVSFNGSVTARFGANLNANDIGINGSGAKTLVSWIKTTQVDKRYFWGWSPDNGQVAGSDIRLGIENSGKLRFEVSSGFARYDGISLNDGNWHMVAVIIESNDTISTIDYYIDGNIYSATGNTTTLINTAGSGSGGVNTPNEIFFGSGGNTDQQHWIGNLDDFRIYDTALTDTELDTIYNAVLVPEPSTALLMLGGVAGLAGIRRRK